MPLQALPMWSPPEPLLVAPGCADSSNPVSPATCDPWPASSSARSSSPGVAAGCRRARFARACCGGWFSSPGLRRALWAAELPGAGSPGRAPLSIPFGLPFSSASSSTIKRPSTMAASKAASRCARHVPCNCTSSGVEATAVKAAVSAGAPCSTAPAANRSSDNTHLSSTVCPTMATHMPASTLVPDSRDVRTPSRDGCTRSNDDGSASEPKRIDARAHSSETSHIPRAAAVRKMRLRFGTQPPPHTQTPAPNMGLCVVCAAIFMTCDAIARVGGDIPVKVTAMTMMSAKWRRRRRA